MTLNDGDKAIVKEVATEMKDSILEWVDNRIDEKIDCHALRCGHRRFMAAMTLFAGIIGGFVAKFGDKLFSKP